MKMRDQNVVTVKSSPVPRSWRSRFSSWRVRGGAETAVQLIMEAARPGRIEGAWTYVDAMAALECLEESLPRSRARRRRLRGLLARLQPRKAKPVAARPVPVWCLTCRGGVSGIRVERLARNKKTGAETARHAWAIGSWDDMRALAQWLVKNWADLPCGQEVHEGWKRWQKFAAKEPEPGAADGPPAVSEKTGGLNDPA